MKIFVFHRPFNFVLQQSIFWNSRISLCNEMIVLQRLVFTDIYLEFAHKIMCQFVINSVLTCHEKCMYKLHLQLGTHG